MGATGLVGRFCLESLLSDNSYDQVTVLARRVPDLQHPRLKVILTDLSELEKQAIHFAVRDVFCCLGTTMRKAGSQQAFRRVDYEYPLRIAQISRKRGTSQFLLVSTLGADPHSKIFYNRVKGELEEALSKIDFQGIQILRPSLLTGPRREFRLKEKIAGLLMVLATPFLQGRFQKYRPVSARVVARAMVEIAKTELPGINIFESDQIRFFVNQVERKNAQAC